MVVQVSVADGFAEFVTAHESRLRRALTASFGGELGREATADALEYAWEHWDRIRVMENPVGYLYKVGRSRGRRELRRKRVMFDPVDPARIPDVEPKLPGALAGLSSRQRSVVVLVHGYGWTHSEVAELLGVSRSSVRSHLERGLSSLRGVIGGVK